IDAGAVGCNLEDSVPANGSLRETEDQSARIRRSRQSADAAKIHFFINARTDIFLQRPPEQHNEAMVAEAIERARAYAEAGADGLFAPGLADLTLVGQAVPPAQSVFHWQAEPPAPPIADRARSA